MKELHEGPIGGHFVTELTHKKILDVEYWWPTMFIDLHDYCRSCDACQQTKGLAIQSLAKLMTSLPKEQFMKWAFDFMGPIKPIRRYIGKKYIFITTDYVTKWVEGRTLRINIATITKKFLYECILTKFECPLIIVTN
jgi:hypothetical protein